VTQGIRPSAADGMESRGEESRKRAACGILDENASPSQMGFVFLILIQITKTSPATVAVQYSARSCTCLYTLSGRRLPLPAIQACGNSHSFHLSPSTEGFAVAYNTTPSYGAINLV
jgi:hypothetical protein